MTFSERIKEFSDTWEATGSLYQAGLLIPNIVDDEYFETLKPEQKFYTCRKYDRKSQVNSSELYDRLNSLVKQNVPKSPIFTYNKRKNSFIAENKDIVMKELLEELNKTENINENNFNKQEKEIEKQENKEFEEIYKNELAEYENIFNPTQEWLKEKFKEYHKRIVEKMGGVWVASGASISVDKTANGQNKYTIDMLVDNLTDFANNFSHKYSVTAAGNFSSRVKSEKQIDEEYAQNVCALAFVYAVCLFNVCLDAKDVLVSCYINHIEPSTGNEESRYLYSVIIPRELIKSFRMENLNTVAALMSLKGRADIRKEREIYFIDPLEWNLDIGTSQEEQVEEINIDFRRLNISLSLPAEFEADANLMQEKIDNLKQIFKDKLIEFEIISDGFDGDNYISGLCNLVISLSLLKSTNEELFESQNYQLLSDELEKIFNSNKYAMGEIQKLIDYDIIPKLKKGDDNVPINSVVYFLLRSVFDNEE